MRIRMSERPVKFPILLHNVQRLMSWERWDQNDVAEYAGVSQGSVSRWGSTSAPRGPALAKLSDRAGVTPSEFLEKQLPEQRPKPRDPLTLPNGPKLVEAMGVLLDSAGLSHLADEYAEKLARRLPSLLEEMRSPQAPPERDSRKRRGGRPQGPSKPHPGKRP